MRRFFITFLCVFVSLTFFASCEQEELNLSTSPDVNVQLLGYQANALIGSSGRIAISADGNDHDRDDIGATPMGLAMIAHAGLRNKLVHYDYNSHIWSNASNSQKKDMTESTLGAASRFGFNNNVFISAIDNPSKAIQSITDAVNSSSSSNPLFIILAGPAAVICKGVNNSNPAKRKYVTVISHHKNNENHTDDTKNACVGDDLRQSGVNFVRISNQNKNFNTKNWSEYNWLKNHANANLRWVYGRMKKAFGHKADISDAGMVWYLLKNDQKGSPSKLKSFFANSTPEPDPDPQPQPSDEAHTIPGQIEAEAYATMSGIKTESTSDAGGGDNIGYINSGDYADYQVDVASAGSYEIAFRVASNTSGGTISLKKGSSTLSSVKVSNTGGWQSWKTVKTQVQLASGKQTLRLQFSSGSGYLFNMNYIKFASTTSGGGDEPTSDPDPTDDAKTVTLTPVQDAYLDDGKRYNTKDLRVENNHRVSYIMFDLRNVTGSISKATLKLAVNGDPGNGTIKIYQGSHHNWTESNLSESNKPATRNLLGSLKSNFPSGSTHTLSLTGLSSGGKVTLVIKHSSGNDIAFSSVEGSSKPTLVVTSN